MQSDSVMSGGFLYFQLGCFPFFLVVLWCGWRWRSRHSLCELGFHRNYIMMLRDLTSVPGLLCSDCE